MEVESKAKELQTAEPPLQVSLRTDNVQINPRVDSSLSDEKSWDFKQIFGMKRHITTVEIDPGLAQGSSIYSFSNTPRNVLALFDAANLSSYFAFFRYNLKFHIEIESAMQHVGALIVNQLNVTPTVASYSPITWCGLPRYSNMPPFRERTILPHSFITLGHNGFYSLTMPWICSRKILPTGAPVIPTSSGTVYSHAALHDYDMGYIDLAIFSPLRVQAAVYSTVSVRILATLENTEYSGYKPSYSI